MKILLFVALALLGYFAWERYNREVPQTLPPAPSPTPTVRLTPDGILMVTKRFSVKVPGGVYGFPIGKEVRIVREEASEFVITDGVTEGRAPKNHFTNNLDAAEAIAGEDRSRREAYNAKMADQADQSKVAKQSLEARQKSVEITQLENQVRQLEVKYRALELQLGKLRGEIGASGRYDGMTDRLKLAEKNERALSQNEEARAKLQLKIQALRVELMAADEEARVLAE